jgi:hypothetical protein
MGDVFNFRGFGRLARITPKRIFPMNRGRSGYLTEKQFCNVLMSYDDEITEEAAGPRIERSRGRLKPPVKPLRIPTIC